jgi:hypothetical protein
MYRRPSPLGDLEGVAERSRKPIIRCEYRAPLPKSDWHIDGNHKLGPQRLVIHEGIDGHSHLIVLMHVSDHNRADTVMDLFL